MAENLSSPYRNILLNISTISAEAKTEIKVVRAKSNELLLIRPTMHLTINSTFGLYKTTLANRMINYCTGSNHPAYKTSNVTAPAIAGSIDENYRVVPPISVKAINGTIFVDEFNTSSIDRSHAIGCALDVLETEESNRDMARMPKKPLKSKGLAQVQYKIMDGSIKFYGLRSNWIFFTARYLQMNRSLPMAMLLSRTVPIRFEPTWDEIDELDDNPNLLFAPLHFTVPDLQNPIANSEYKEIRNLVKDVLQRENIPRNYLNRTVNDCIRAYVFTGFKHDENLFKYIIQNKAMFVSDLEKIGTSLAEFEATAEAEILDSKLKKGQGS